MIQPYIQVLWPSLYRYIWHLAKPYPYYIRGLISAQWYGYGTCTIMAIWPLYMVMACSPIEDIKDIVQHGCDQSQISIEYDAGAKPVFLITDGHVTEIVTGSHCPRNKLVHR